MKVHVSPEMGKIIDDSVAHSIARANLYVGVEHLYETLVENGDLLPPKFMEQFGSALAATAREMATEPWKGMLQLADGEVFFTPRCVSITNQSIKLAERYRVSPGALHVLLSVLADAYSQPSRAMDRLRLNRGAILQALQNEVLRHAASTQIQLRQATATAPKGQAAGTPPVSGRPTPAAQPAPPVFQDPFKQPEVTDDTSAAKASLDALTRDLTVMARAGKLQPAIGRDSEMREITETLARKTKNNIMLLGEAGVGKTQLIEGLAIDSVRPGGNSILAQYCFLELNLSALMAGTAYRGEFEEKVLALMEQLKSRPDVVLFIDEVHLIMGAGSTDGGGMDLANLLKPALARGEIRCIGATTLQEYRKFVEKDPAIERRFQMVRVEPLSEQASKQVLEHLRPSFESYHRVKVPEAVIDAAITLSQRYMPNRNLPDKAIDILDQACARYRVKMVALRNNPAMLQNTVMPNAHNEVTPHDVRKVVSQLTGIPIDEMTAEERKRIVDLDRRLKKRLIGQDEAVTRVSATVKRSRAGLADPNRPDAVMLFLGPSGVGKTQLAKLLAEQLFGSSNHFVTFDMSEYIEEHSVSKLLGSPPGYQGADEEGRLTTAIRNAPFSVLLFDEVEKAHPRVFDIFLPIFDEGRLKDNRGRNLSFKDTIIILTSNIGAEVLAKMGPGPETMDALMEELRKHFRPELINRIDEIVPFYPLLFEDVRTILRIYMHELRDRLTSKRIGIRMYQQAYEHLARMGYTADAGARGLRRAVDQLVANPISEKLIKGEFKAGDWIEIAMDGDKLAFRKGAQPQSQSEPLDK